MTKEPTSRCLKPSGRCHRDPAIHGHGNYHKPIAPLFLPDLVVLSTIRAGFPKRFPETSSLLRYPGPWSVRSQNFRELLFGSPHPHRHARGASYTRDPPPLISNQHALLQLSCPASNEKSAMLNIYGIGLTLIAMGASVPRIELNSCPYWEQTWRSQTFDWLEVEDNLRHVIDSLVFRVGSQFSALSRECQPCFFFSLHLRYTPPSRSHPSCTI